MATNDNRATAERLRAWADGSVTLIAAVEMLTDALGGRLLDGPWVRRDSEGRAWLDPDVAARTSGALSGGERRVVAVAMSLVSEHHPVDLGDAIAGLDPDAAAVVLRALARAAGVREGDS